jgi:hypothetical protein
MGDELRVVHPRGATEEVASKFAASLIRRTRLPELISGVELFVERTVVISVPVEPSKMNC